MNLKIASLIMIIVGVSARLLPHPPNMAPITALALFSGVYLPKKYFFIPLAAMFISDMFIGFYGITMLYVYGSFALVGLLGWWLRNQKGAFNIFVASIASSVLFYLITNFAVWLYPHSFYSKDLSGLLESYYLAIPFFRNTLLGDLGYTTLFFGSYELAKALGRKYLPERIYKVTF